MKKLRAKFYCNSVKSDEYGENISLSAVYGTDDKDNEENNQFAEETPSGDLTMYVSNPNAKGFFKEGNQYYLDFQETKDINLLADNDDSSGNPPPPGGHG